MRFGRHVIYTNCVGLGGRVGNKTHCDPCFGLKHVLFDAFLYNLIIYKKVLEIDTGGLCARMVSGFLALE